MSKNKQYNKQRPETNQQDKHRNFNNYNEYSKKHSIPPTEHINEELEIDEKVVDLDDAIKEEPLIGVVKCKKLNVRKNPNLESEILMTVTEGDNVELNIKASNREFYKVLTESKEEGFCMKKFISIKS